MQDDEQLRFVLFIQWGSEMNLLKVLVLLTLVVALSSGMKKIAASVNLENILRFVIFNSQKN